MYFVYLVKHTIEPFGVCFKSSVRMNYIFPQDGAEEDGVLWLIEKRRGLVPLKMANCI